MCLKVVLSDHLWSDFMSTYTHNIFHAGTAVYLTNVPQSSYSPSLPHIGRSSAHHYLNTQITSRKILMLTFILMYPRDKFVFSFFILFIVLFNLLNRASYCLCLWSDQIMWIHTYFSCKCQMVQNHKIKWKLLKTIMQRKKRRKTNKVASGVHPPPCMLSTWAAPTLLLIQIFFFFLHEGHFHWLSYEDPSDCKNKLCSKWIFKWI